MKAKVAEHLLIGDDDFPDHYDDEQSTLELVGLEISKGKALFDSEQYSEALQCFHDARYFLEERNVRFKEETVTTHYWLSRTLHQQGEYSDAIAAARTASRISYALEESVGVVNIEELWKSLGLNEEQIEEVKNSMMQSVELERHGDCLYGNAAILHYLQAVDLEEATNPLSVDLAVLWRKIAVVSSRHAVMEMLCGNESETFSTKAIQRGDFLRREMAYAGAISEYRRAALTGGAVSDCSAEVSSSVTAGDEWLKEDITDSFFDLFSSLWKKRIVWILVAILGLSVVAFKLSPWKHNQSPSEQKLEMDWQHPLSGLYDVVPESMFSPLAKSESYLVMMNVIEDFQERIHIVLATDHWRTLMEKGFSKTSNFFCNAAPPTETIWTRLPLPVWMSMALIVCITGACVVGLWLAAARHHRRPESYEERLRDPLERLKQLLQSSKEEAVAEFRRMLALEELFLEDLRFGFAKLLTDTVSKRK